MKQEYLLWAIFVLLITNTISIIGWGIAANDIASYQQYYKGAEGLLDTLEAHYNWVDAIDDNEYYDAVEKIK